MTITCYINDQHRVVLKPTDSTGEYKIVAVHADLSSTNMFQNPALPSDKTGLEQVFLPLVEEAKVAFGMLAELEEPNSNQTVAGLRLYAQETLPLRIKEINEMHQAGGGLDYSVIESCHNALKSANPKMQIRILRAIVDRVNREFPRFFDIEKGLGTYKFVRSGCDTRNLSFTLELQGLAPEVIEGKTMGSFVLSAHTGKPLLNLVNDTVFLDSIEMPDSKTILTAMLYGGSLGPEILSLNKGVAIRQSMREGIEHLSVAKKELAIINSFQRGWTRALHDYGKSIAEIAFGGLTGAITFFMKPYSIFDLAFLGVATLFFYSGCRELYKNYLLRHDRAEKRDDRSDHLDVMVNRSRIIYQTRLSEVLGKFLETHGASSNRSALAPEPYKTWAECRQPRQGDMFALPHFQPSSAVPAMPYPGTLNLEIIPENGQSVDVENREGIINHVLEAVMDIKQIETAHKAWNQLHATYLLDSFTRSLQSARGRSQRFELNDIVDFMQRVHCDMDQDYPPVWVQLQKQLQIKGIELGNNWKYISRALYAWDLIERQHISLEVQKIAIEEVRKSLNIS